jgi:hypothetical protein
MSERRSGTIISVPSTPPSSARVKMVQYSKKLAPLLSVVRKRKPGRVNTTPAAMDSPAEPIVCTTLFSRMVEPPSFLSSEMASTAMGMEAETVRPALSARYTVAAPKMMPKSTPMPMAFGVNSATSLRSAGM